MSSDETVILVDENDEIIGYKLRRDLEQTDRWRIITIWIENSHGEILLSQRADNLKNNPGCWGPACAGTVVKGQSYLECAKQELAEELGITDLDIKEFVKIPYISDNGNRRVCQFYKATADLDPTKLNLQPGEVKAAKWISRPALRQQIADHRDQFVSSASMWPELFDLK